MLVRSGIRQAARTLECGKTTIARKVAVLARQALRFHVASLGAGPPIGGDVLFDGLRSAEGSKFAPYDLNVAIQRESSFVLGITEAPLRRSGTLSRKQRAKRAHLEGLHGKPSGNATREAIAELLVAIKPSLDLTSLRFVTDEHKAYPPAIRDAGLEAVPHLTISSRKFRNHRNELFEINLSDALIRHTQSCHTRKTLALNKRRQAGIERGWLWILQRNYMFQRRVNGPEVTPAMLAGIASRPLVWEDIFTRRVLPHEVELPPVWRRHIAREIITRAFAKNARNTARYAE